MPAKKPTYSELSEELDDVLVRLQGEEIDVDEAIKLYERGMALAGELETYLKAAENKIEELKSSHGL